MSVFWRDPARVYLYGERIRQRKGAACGISAPGRRDFYDIKTNTGGSAAA